MLIEVSKNPLIDASIISEDKLKLDNDISLLDIWSNVDNTIIEEDERL